MAEAKWFMGFKGIWHMVGGCKTRFPMAVAVLQDEPITYGDPTVFQTPRRCRACVAAQARAWTQPDRRVRL
jgi:hypothetical protein